MKLLVWEAIFVLCCLKRFAMALDSLLVWIEEAYLLFSLCLWVVVFALSSLVELFSLVLGLILTLLY
jgi:hypothetical protein